MRRPSFCEQEALEGKAAKRLQKAAATTQKDAGPSAMRTLNQSASRDVSESRDSPVVAAPSASRLLTSGPPDARTPTADAPKTVRGDAARRGKGKTVGCGADKTTAHDKEWAAGCAINGTTNHGKDKAVGCDKSTVGDASGSKRPPPDEAAKIPKKQRVAPPLPSSSEVVSLSLTPGDFIDSATAAASLFSGITLPAEHLPSPSTLSRSRSYADMSLRGAKFFSSLNSMVLRYEADAHRDLSRLESAREGARSFKKWWREDETKGSAEREKAAKEIYDLKSKVWTLEKSCEEARNENIMLKHGITKRDSRIAKQQSVIDTATEAYDSQVTNAVADAKCELVKGFQEKMKRAKGKLKTLTGDVATRMAFLAQVDANIELVELLQGEEPPSLAEEMKSLEAHGLTYTGAYEDFEKAATAMKAELVISEIAHGFTTGEPIELSAARIGACDQFGSNDGNHDLQS